MREFITLVENLLREGQEDMDGITVSINPSPRQIVGLCSRLSGHKTLRGYFFTTKTDTKPQFILWGAEYRTHFDMQRIMRRAGLDMDHGQGIIVSLNIDSLMKSCDWDSWDAYQSGELFYVADEFTNDGTFDSMLMHYFPNSGESLELEWDGIEWEIIED